MTEYDDELQHGRALATTTATASADLDREANASAPSQANPSRRTPRRPHGRCIWRPSFRWRCGSTDQAGRRVAGMTLRR